MRAPLSIPRVAMIAEYPLDSGVVDGGVQAANTYLIEALARSQNIDLHVVSFHSTVSSPTSRSENGFTRHIMPSQRFGAISLWRKNYQLLKRCLHDIRPHIVHAQGADSYGYLAVKSRYPSVVTFHGIIGIDAKFKRRFLDIVRHTMLGRIAEKYCAANADHAIMISPYVEQVFGNLLRGVKHHIPNPIHDTYFNLDRADEPGRILFAGRVVSLKGVSELIRAFRTVRNEIDAKLVLAGSLTTDSVYVESLRELVGRLDLNENVIFRGLLSEADIVEEFRRASVLVLPSFQENAPMVIQQAMAAGLPVVASAVGGVPHMIRQGQAGRLVEPGDVEELAQAIIASLTDKSFRTRVARRARDLSQRFRAQTVAEETLRVYRLIAHSLSGQPR